MDARMKVKLLDAMEKNAKLDAKQLAALLGLEEAEVADEIKNLEKAGIVRSYHTLIDWNKADDTKVSAVIEVSIKPQQGNGYEKIAEKIYSYPEVLSMRLMSGSYDFLVTLHNATMKEIATFVASKIAIIEGVRSASTHFILQSYKEMGNILVENEKTKREMVNPI